MSNSTSNNTSNKTCDNNSYFDHQAKTQYACRVECCAVRLDACGSAARQFAEDVVDEIVTKISGHLSDVRQVCQAGASLGKMKNHPRNQKLYHRHRP
eukprot:343449-Amphidinium_carterae.1